VRIVGRHFLQLRPASAGAVPAAAPVSVWLGDGRAAAPTDVVVVSDSLLLLRLPAAAPGVLPLSVALQAAPGHWLSSAACGVGRAWVTLQRSSHSASAAAPAAAAPAAADTDDDSIAEYSSDGDTAAAGRETAASPVAAGPSEDLPPQVSPGSLVRLATVGARGGAGDAEPGQECEWQSVDGGGSVAVAVRVPGGGGGGGGGAVEAEEASALEAVWRARDALSAADLCFRFAAVAADSEPAPTGVRAAGLALRAAAAAEVCADARRGAWLTRLAETEAASEPTALVAALAVPALPAAEDELSAAEESDDEGLTPGDRVSVD
jgi:hypothetical protein